MTTFSALSFRCDSSTFCDGWAVDPLDVGWCCRLWTFTIPEGLMICCRTAGRDSEKKGLRCRVERRD